MKTRRRVVAVICCLAMLIGSLNIGGTKDAQAAVSVGTISISDRQVGYASNGHYINMTYDGVPGDYAGGVNFFSEEFANQYITYGGGMTYSDLSNGVFSFYLANSDTLQFNWSNNTSGFTVGHSFTIAKGALLPYTTTESGTAYVELDKEYTFIFREGNTGNDYVVDIEAYDTTTFSMKSLEDTGAPIANGKEGGGQNIHFEGITDYSAKYGWIENETIYSEYIEIPGVTFEKLSDVGVEMRVILDGATCFQITEWGQLRSELGVGDQIILRKGLPIYYIGSDGATNCRATLDADYIYEVVGSNSDHDQIMGWTRVDENAAYNFIQGDYTTLLQGVDEQYINLEFLNGSSVVSGSQVEMLTECQAEEYIDFAGFTVEEAYAMGVSMRFIPAAGVIQMAFSPNAVSQMQVGDEIILKKGFAITYPTTGYGVATAVLTEDYAIRVTSNNGTNLGLHCECYTSFGLSTEVFYYYSGAGYMDIRYSLGSFEDAESYETSVPDDAMEGYLEISGIEENELASNGYSMREYHVEALKGLRVLVNSENFNLVNGSEIVFKKGFPLVYRLASGGTKTAYLDRDYGYRYNGEGAFIYDSSITGESVNPVVVEFELGSQAASYPEGDYQKTNLPFSGAAVTADSSVDILADDATAEYIDILGMTTEEARARDMKILFIPSASVFQIVWGADVAWIPSTGFVTFEAGMPVNYTSGGEEKTIVLAEQSTYVITNDGTEAVMKKVAATDTFGITTKEFGTGIDAEGTTLGLTAGTLDDAATQYLSLSTALLEQYVEYAGLSTEEIQELGVVVRLIRDGGTKTLQILWGSSVEQLKVGERIILKEGMPFVYTTESGQGKYITLDKDYNFEVCAGNEENTRVLRYTDTLVGGSYGAASGRIIDTSASESDGSFYTNIPLSSGSLDDVVDNTYIRLSADVMAQYVDFCGLNPDEYGISVMVIRANTNTRVIQLQWGSATEQCKIGDEIVLKKGLPITCTEQDGTQRIYTLDADYTYVIKEGTAGSANGYAVSGIKELVTVLPGDVDDDLLLNANDVELTKKAILGAIVASDEVVDSNEDKAVNVKDWVHMVKAYAAGGEPESYTTIYDNYEAPSVVAPGQTITYEINESIEKMNYMRLTFLTTQNLYGTVTYQVEGGSTYSENFYVESVEVQFEQFFDNYRPNGVLGSDAMGNASNLKNKVLKSITFKNVGKADAQIRLNEVEMSDRAFETNAQPGESDFIYADNGSLKVGADLRMGGCLTWLESTKYDVHEVQDTKNYKVTVEVEPELSSTRKSLDDTVNLINIRDRGREIQQSFYADVQDPNYVRADYNENEDWPYNPVQGGDQYDNQAQIIDYRVTDEFIYIKARAMDWAQNNSTTKSYMENWYRLEDNLLYVENRFVDWNGFTDMGSGTTQEVPAVYTAQSLNTFVTDEGDKGIYRDSGLESWTGSDYYSTDQRGLGSYVPDWYAWVNDADFGFGIYIPGVDYTVAGRTYSQTSYPKNALDGLNSDKESNASAEGASILEFGYCETPTSKYSNQYLRNTGYIAPVFASIMQEYVPMEYTYVLTVDKLENIQASFDSLTESGTILNESFDRWPDRQ